MKKAFILGTSIFAVLALVVVFGRQPLVISPIAEAHTFVTHTPTPTRTPTPTPKQVDCHKDKDNWNKVCENKTFNYSCPRGWQSGSCPTPPDDSCPTNSSRNEDKVCVCNSGFHQSQVVLDEVKVAQTPIVCEPDPTPEVTPAPNPGGPGDGQHDGGASDPGATRAPVCPNGQTDQLVANLHVIRKGSEATVNFFITQGDSANLYYKVSGHSDWENAVPNLTPNGDKFVSYTVNGLDPNTAYDFGVQQKYGCGGGPIATSVVVDGPESHVFNFSYWQW